MSSPSGEDVPVEILTQETRELQIVSRFDFFTIQKRATEGSGDFAFSGLRSGENRRDRSRQSSSRGYCCRSST